jgi:hypothetical protein
MEKEERTLFLYIFLPAGDLLKHCATLEMTCTGYETKSLK